MKIKLNTEVNKEIFLLLDKILELSQSSQLENIKIALGEVIQNIIRHEYNNVLTGEEWIEVDYEINNELIIYIRDYAKPIKNDFLKKNFFANELGHMGLNIIRKVASSFNIKPITNGNLTEITFAIK
jgi:anti-sigma regulatory factor (Ser/Thr protein kinase)